MSRLLPTVVWLVSASVLNVVAIQAKTDAQVVDPLGRRRVETAHDQSQSQPRTSPPSQTDTGTPSSDPPAIDPTRLGVSFDRVRMQLTETPPSKSKGLKIQETIEVVGKAPTTLLWNPKTVNLTSAAVPFGAPTQKDIMKLIVPKEFQTSPFDLNALMQWLMGHLNKKAE